MISLRQNKTWMVTHETCLIGLNFSVLHKTCSNISELCVSSVTALTATYNSLALFNKHEFKLVSGTQMMK